MKTFKPGDRVKTLSTIKNIHPKFKTAVLEVVDVYGQFPSCGIVKHPDGETTLVGWEEIEAAGETK